MNWLSVMFQVIGMVIKYGPELWKLGTQVYEIVETIVAAFKRSKPDATPEEVKVLADEKFDEHLVQATMNAERPVPAPVTRTQLRRDVWATRPKNVRKVREGGRKPT